MRASTAESGLPPGPSSPKLWQLGRSQLDFISYMERCAARYGSVFTLRVYPYDRLIVATSPADLEAIYTRTTERFVPGITPPLVLEPILGRTSMFLSTGSTHRRQRSLVKPAFRHDVVTGWSERMTALASEELDGLPTGRPVGMRQPMRDLTLNVICRLVLGVDSTRRTEMLRDDLAMGVDPRVALLLWMPTLWHRDGRLNPARGLRRRRDRIHRMFAEQIALRRADTRIEQRDDVLALMMQAKDESGGALTDGELRDQLMTLLSAGHESTAVTLAWALERLSRTPSVHERLMAELDEGREEYLEAVIKETLRTRPPVLDSIRTTTEEIELSGYRIPRGTLVTAGFTVTHRDPKLWDDPLAFRPERFLEGRPRRYAYAPFGGGNRLCAGASLGRLEMRLVLKEALRRFRLEPAPGPEDKIKLVGLTLVPSREATVVLRSRSREPAAHAGSEAL